MTKHLACLAITLLVVFVGPAALRTWATPPEVADGADNWPLPNQNYANTRATFSSPISSANVSQLEPAWSFPLKVSDPVGFGVAATNPLILGDRVYFEDLQSNVYAVGLQDGALAWKRSIDQGNFGPNGVAVGWGKLFAIRGNNSISALDLATGADVWSVNLARSDVEGITIQPLAYDDTVYLSTVPVTTDEIYGGGATGVIYALDEATGKTRWSFDTVDSADIWGNSKVNSGGGAWYSPAVDEQRGVTYWGIGNPGPWPGVPGFPNGSSRPGDNLYTNSMLALGESSGDLKWFNQVGPHDLFDHDFQSSPILATIAINGTPRDIVIGAGKIGKVFAFDRNTGETLWSTSVGKHQNDDVTSVPPGQTLEVYPGIFGGVETPMAYADGVVFVPAVNHPSYHTQDSWDVPFDFSKSNGNLVAIEVATGKVLWDTVLDSIPLGATTVVNDLVFTSTFDGTILALDRATGHELWSYQAPGGINGWPAVAGDMILFPVGVQDGTVPAQMMALRLKPVPEPSGLVLAGVACFVLALQRCRSTPRGRSD